MIFDFQVPDNFGISPPVATSHSSLCLTLPLRGTGDLASQTENQSKELRTTGCESESSHSPLD